MKMMKKNMKLNSFFEKILKDLEELYSDKHK